MHHKVWIALGCVACLPSSTLAQSNIDPRHKSAWGENVGWTNWRDAGYAREGVRVGEDFLSGYVWAENVGWIDVGDGDGPYSNIDDTDFGVNIDTETGYLSGYAWAENVGWINFDTSPLGEDDRAGFDAVAGLFHGYAWGENIGWINLNHDTHYVATMGEDIPAVSDWGLIVMGLLVLTAGTVVCLRRSVVQV